MKAFRIACIALLAVSSASFGGNLGSCSFNGIPLYGKVKVVDAFAVTDFLICPQTAIKFCP